MLREDVQKELKREDAFCTEKIVKQLAESVKTRGNKAPTRARGNKRYSIDLPAHMAECDANFLRLLKLFPTLRTDDDCCFGVSVGGTLSLIVIHVVERGPYTTLIRIASPEEPGWRMHPTFRVRLYHDARSAEVVEYQKARHFHAVYDYPNSGMRQPDEKAQINRFLGEFLSVCLECGVTTEELITLPTS